MALFCYIELLPWGFSSNILKSGWKSWFYDFVIFVTARFYGEMMIDEAAFYFDLRSELTIETGNTFWQGDLGL